MTIDRRNGVRFDDARVAHDYANRPPYPAELYEFLLARLPRRERALGKHRRALDLGCGVGQIAGGLARSFDRVDAVDPALPMLQRGRVLYGGLGNIHWIHGRAEDAELQGPYDLVAIGAAVHWMDHAIVFPKLAQVLGNGGVLAVIEGDGAFDPPWHAQWVEFLQRWLARVGREYDEGRFAESAAAYERWMDVAGRHTFVGSFRQSVADFVSCQHSRATWTRTQLGNALVEEFDQELTGLLKPHACDDQLEFVVHTNLTWGTPHS